MEMQIYSIYDTASAAYMRPFYATIKTQAIRAFTDLVTDINHPVGQHPEDYSLQRIGTWHDGTGTLTNQTNECVQTGLETLALSQQQNSNQIDLFQTEQNHEE